MNSFLSRFLLIAVLLSLAVTTNGRAQDKSDLSGHEMSSREDFADNPCMKRIPGLSQDQKDQMKKLHLRLLKESLPLQNQLREKEAILTTLQSSEKPILDAIHNQIQEIGQIKTDLAIKEASHHQEIRKILNEEQRILFDTEFSKMANLPDRREKRNGFPKSCKHPKPEKRKKAKKTER
jgi:Spy/CpxP family protein refolding chaperone